MFFHFGFQVLVFQSLLCVFFRGAIIKIHLLPLWMMTGYQVLGERENEIRLLLRCYVTGFKKKHKHIFNIFFCSIVNRSKY